MWERWKHTEQRCLLPVEFKTETTAPPLPIFQSHSGVSHSCPPRNPIIPEFTWIDYTWNFKNFNLQFEINGGFPFFLVGWSTQSINENEIVKYAAWILLWQVRNSIIKLLWNFEYFVLTFNEKRTFAMLFFFFLFLWCSIIYSFRAWLISRGFWKFADKVMILGFEENRRRWI